MPERKAPATKRFPKKTPDADAEKPADALIDARIQELADWRGALLSRLRNVIRSAHADISEEWKWNTPVWSCGGIICTGETYKKAVKLTFAKGASLPDPQGLFNSSLDGKIRRAIDFTEDSPVDQDALVSLVQAAVDLNRSNPSGRPASAA